MEQTFNGNDKLGDIVTELPQAAELFKQYRIDFCCGGHRQLMEVVKEHNLNQTEILNRLNELYQKMYDNIGEKKDWSKESYSELINYIINTHHKYLQKELPELSQLVTKILRVHGSGHQDLQHVHKLFHTLKMDLDQHLIKEEEILFPLIKEYEENPSQQLLGQINNTIQELESEHIGAGDILKELRKVTEEYKLPEDACRTFASTYQKLQDLESDLFAHIHLENNILFPRLQQKH